MAEDRIDEFLERKKQQKGRVLVSIDRAEGFAPRWRSLRIISDAELRILNSNYPKLGASNFDDLSDEIFSYPYRTSFTYDNVYQKLIEACNCVPRVSRWGTPPEKEIIDEWCKAIESRKMSESRYTRLMMADTKGIVRYAQQIVRRRETDRERREARRGKK